MNYRLTIDDGNNIIWEFDSHSIRTIKRYAKNNLNPFYSGVMQIHETNNCDFGKLVYEKQIGKRWVKK